MEDHGAFKAKAAPRTFKPPSNHVILILIPVVWVALMGFFVLLCRGAGRADTMLVIDSSGNTPRASQRRGLTLFEDPRAHLPRGRHRAGSEPATGRGARARGGRCVAGS
jgi:hypothetical protein